MHTNLCEHFYHVNRQVKGLLITHFTAILTARATDKLAFLENIPHFNFLRSVFSDVDRTVLMLTANIEAKS